MIYNVISQFFHAITFSPSVGWRLMAMAGFRVVGNTNIQAKRALSLSYLTTPSVPGIDPWSGQLPAASDTTRPLIIIYKGMGNTVTTAGRIFKGQSKWGVSGEDGSLTWERFSNFALIKTYNLDKQVPDSAGTATAYLCGVKTNMKTIGVTGAVTVGDCEASLKKENRVSSILKWSQESGKETGFVTSTRITHATPAALYAHTSNRGWESDKDLEKAKNSKKCKDIARQLIEDSPGKDIKVIFGGGREQFGAGNSSFRSDSSDLVKKWIKDKSRNKGRAVYVTNNEEFEKIDPDTDDYIMGLFSADHMPYSYYRNTTPQGTPSLEALTQTAIKRLQRSSQGFFLLVEGGRIDHALHHTKPRIVFEELLAFEEAVASAVKMTDPQDTLIIVTADHSHVMTFNGYPDRGNDILGTTTYEKVTDQMPYTTLMFTNGAGGNYTWDGSKVVRANVAEIDTRDPEFMPQATVPKKEGSETHGGEDVALFATGAMSHLFHGVKEQSYVAHAMGYAACVGPHKDSWSSQGR